MVRVDDNQGVWYRQAADHSDSSAAVADMCDFMNCSCGPDLMLMNAAGSDFGCS